MKRDRVSLQRYIRLREDPIYLVHPNEFIVGLSKPLSIYRLPSPMMPISQIFNLNIIRQVYFDFPHFKIILLALSFYFGF